MEFNNIPPKWDAQGAEPTTELQANGFTAGYKPPAAYFNYMFNRYTACMSEIQALIEELETAKQEMTEDIVTLTNTIGNYTGGGEKNLLQYETIVNDAEYGKYCTVNNDGSIAIKNTTADKIYPKTDKQTLDVGIYTFSVTSDVAGIRCYLMRGDAVIGQFYTIVGTHTQTFSYDKELTFRVQFDTPANTTGNVYAQLEKGDTATAFEGHILSVADVLNSLPTTYVTRKEYEQQMGELNSVLENLIG